MKKTIFALFLVAALVSCGGGASSETEVKDSLTTTPADSLAVEVDSSAVIATDSTVGQIPTGGGSSETTQPIK